MDGISPPHLHFGPYPSGKLRRFLHPRGKSGLRSLRSRKSALVPIMQDCLTHITVQTKYATRRTGMTTRHSSNLSDTKIHPLERVVGHVFLHYSHHQFRHQPVLYDTGNPCISRVYHSALPLQIPRQAIHRRHVSCPNHAAFSLNVLCQCQQDSAISNLDSVAPCLAVRPSIVDIDVRKGWESKKSI